MVVTDIRCWSNKSEEIASEIIRCWSNKSEEIASEIIPYVTRVSMALGIDKELRMPPKAQANERGEIDGSYLPAVLFPTYTKCKNCGLLHKNPWRKDNKRLTDKVFCEVCKGNLEQITWCAVSNKGHLSEVPWHYICHQNSDKECKADYEANYLKFDTDTNGKRIIKCLRCQSSNYYDKAKLNIINGVQPWIYEKAPKLEEEAIVEVLEVNNPGVYLPERVNALVIPPESRISKTTVVDRLLAILGEKFNFSDDGFDGSSPSHYYTMDDGYRFGIIEPYEDDFCKQCNRIRLTAEGKLIPCLYFDEAMSIAESIKKGDIKGAALVLKEVIRTKPEKNRWGGEDGEVSTRAFYETGG